MSGSGNYISREAAIEAMYKDAEVHPGHTFWTSQCEALMDIPAADVRPVVYCRDCKYWFNAPVADGFNSCERDALIRHENFFCAAGEKREES